MSVKKPVVILGAGGHAHVVIDCLLQNGIQIIAVADKIATKKNFIEGIPIIAEEELITSYLPTEVVLVNGIGSTQSTTIRTAIYRKFKSLGYQFCQVIHPQTIISPRTIIGEGSQIMAGAVIQPGTVIKENSVINTGVSVDHDCEIGENVHLAPGATVSGGVHIGKGTHVGTGAIIIQGVKIGSYSLVAAGAVVLNDVPSDAIVMGIPARVVRR